MSSQTVQSQISLTTWTLDAPGDMWDALVDLAPDGYRGGVRVGPDQTGDAVWELELSRNETTTPPTPPIVATLGNVLARVGTAPVEYLTAAEYDAKYGTGS